MLLKNKDLINKAIKYYLGSFCVFLVVGGMLIWGNISSSDVSLENAYIYALILCWWWPSSSNWDQYKKRFVHYIYLFFASAVLVFIILLDCIELTNIPRCILFHCFDNLIYVVIRIFEEKTGVVVKTNK